MILFICFVYTLFFLGGELLIGFLVMVYVYIFIRAVCPRLRFDKIISMAWTELLI